MRRTPLISFAAAVTAVPLVAVSLAAPASAAPAAEPKPVIKGLITPLSAAVAPNGTAYVAQNFAGSLVKKRPGKKTKVIFTAAKPKKTEVGAVSVRKGVVTFATTKGADGVVWTMNKKGKVSKLASVSAYESSANPDGDVTYGPVNASEECLAEVPPFLQPYTGLVESHPYATTKAGGTTYVADAAGNAIFGVSSNGTTSTVAVLPPIEAIITEEAAEAYELPECLVGEELLLEPVPTDVEMGPDGMLYVSSLPGGPEDGSLGLNGSVFRIDPSTGEATPVVTGLLSPVGVALAPNGDMYVSQLFMGSIVKVPAGSSTPEEFKSVPLPGDVEWSDGFVYATLTDLMNDGSTPPAGKLQRWAD